MKNIVVSVSCVNNLNHANKSFSSGTGKNVTKINQRNSVDQCTKVIISEATEEGGLLSVYLGK